MLQAKMLRFDSSEAGTYSTFISPPFSCFITERPWKDNRRRESCIPAGTYQARWHRSPRFGWCYKLFDVPGRSEILIHPGNYYWNSHGCLLPAKKLGYINGKKAGLSSKVAVQALNQFFNKQPFLLEIQDAYLSSSPTE